MEPDLKMGITLAIFHSVGTTPVSRDELIINVKGFAMTPAASLSNPGGRLSKPVAFFRFWVWFHYSST